MAFDEEKRVLDAHVAQQGLKQSGQRVRILETFLQAGRHLTAEELHRMVRRSRPAAGIATVYRSLRLFCECGVCGEVLLDDGMTRYEPLLGHAHHDHLICTKCGKFVEVTSPETEKIQERIARENGFVLTRHRWQMYGLCQRCRRLLGTFFNNLILPPPSTGRRTAGRSEGQ